MRFMSGCKRSAIIVTLSLLFSFNVVNAQNNDKDGGFYLHRSYSYGLKAGCDYFYTTSDKTETERFLGYVYGKFFPGFALFFHKYFSDEFNSGITLGYANSGEILKLHTGKISTYITSNIHRVDLAIPFNWLPMGSNGGFVMFAGPKFYFVLDTKCAIDCMDKPTIKGLEDVLGIKDKSSVKNANKFNVGINAGIEYEIMRSGVLLGFDAEWFFRYTVKLGEQTDMITGKKTTVGTSISAARLYVGYDFSRII
jgi:hypothetical protein